MPFYTGWTSTKNSTPLEVAPWLVMRFYQGVLLVANAHHYTIERWSDERVLHHEPHELDLEVLNAGLLTKDCGRSAGRGNCQCCRELIFSPSSYRSFPLVSPYLRLERQVMIRNGYVNAIRQADDDFAFEAFPLVDDYGDSHDRSASSHASSWDTTDPTRSQEKEGDESSDSTWTDEEEEEDIELELNNEKDYEHYKDECRAVDYYLMLMMPYDRTGAKDQERYIELPIGRMNGVDLVLQKITVCPDTFQKLFCLSPNQDQQLLQWRKGL
jgi:hypothetical protein